MLIRDGATLVRNADDAIAVLESMPKMVVEEAQIHLQLETPSKPARSLSSFNALHQSILDRLGPSPVAEDQLLRDIGTETREMVPVLTDMELNGKIRRSTGGLISRA